jgi:hypothetical protein
MKHSRGLLKSLEQLRQELVIKFPANPNGGDAVRAQPLQTLPLPDHPDRTLDKVDLLMI